MKIIAVIKRIILLSFIPFIFTTCFLEAPEAPSWELDLVIPLIDEDYPLSDLRGPILEDSSDGFIDVDSNVILRLNVQDTIGTIKISKDLLTVPGIESVTIGEPIGPIELNNIGIDQAFESASLSDISPAVAAAPNGTNVPVPAFNLDPIVNEIAIADVEEADMSQGIIRISVANGFIDAPGSGIPITNLQIVLTGADNAVLGTADFGTINAGATVTRDINLAGKTMVVPISSLATGDSPGVANFTINATSKQGKITITVSFIPPFVATRVKGNLPQIDIDIANSIPLGISGSTVLISGRFRPDTDDMTFSIQNLLQVPLQANLILPNFIDSASNLPKEVSWENIPPGSTELRIVELGGDSLTNPIEGLPLSDIDYLFSASTILTGSSSTITENDAVIITIGLDTLRFKRWKAFFDETIPTTETNIENTPEGFAGITFEDVELIMKLHNTISVPMFLDLDIVGTNSLFGTSAGLSLRNAEIVFPPFFSTQPETTIIKFIKDMTCVNELCQPSGDSDIIDFFNIFPDKITISGKTDLLGEGVVAVGQSLGGGFELKIPFVFSLDSTAKFVPATMNTIAAFPDEQKEQIENNILYAIVESELENHFPLSGTISLLITDDSTKFNVHPDSLFMDTLFTFNLPDTDPDADIFSATSYDSVFLDSSIIRLFTRGEEHFIKPLIILKSTDGKPRSILPSNFIGITSVMTFRIKINP